MRTLHESKVIQACQILFGDEVRLDLDFLYYLQTGGVKTAFRRRAKEFHPDLHQRAPSKVRQLNAERFRELTAAHALMCEFLRQRDAGEWHPQPRRRHAAPTSVPQRKTSARASGPSRGDGRFYHGTLPRIPLSIGRFCYYRGLIPYSVLIEALTWQRRQRPAIGEIARRWGWLSAEGERLIATRSLPGLFGEKAVSLGVLTSRQVKDLLFYQRACQERLGSYFVAQGLVSDEEMTRLVEEMRRHNREVAPFGATSPTC